MDASHSERATIRTRRGSNGRQQGGFESETGQHSPPVLWWPDQRHINQVYPADRVTTASMDFDNFSYQLYVRPGAPKSGDLRANQMLSRSAYNVKRLATDRPYGTRTPDCQLHWGNKQWNATQTQESKDYTSNNNRSAATQPMTPLNPFVTKTSDLNPATASDQSGSSSSSSTTCVSSDAGGSVSSTSNNSCSRREGFDENQNNNGNNCQESGIGNAETENGSERGDVGMRWDQSNSVNRVNVKPKRSKLSCGGGISSSTARANSSSGSTKYDACDDPLSADPKATIVCNAFLPQLGLPSEVREPKIGLGHCMARETIGVIEKQKGRHRVNQICPSDASTHDHTVAAVSASSTKTCKIVPGYGTYKIIGGRQYHEPPQCDPRVGMELALPLAQYREYQRRCPCPQLGRYDRADPDNEMLLPSHKDSTLIKSSLSPFTYLRNPKPHRTATTRCQQRRATQVDIGKGAHLLWKMPTFL